MSYDYYWVSPGEEASDLPPYNLRQGQWVRADQIRDSGAMGAGVSKDEGYTTKSSGRAPAGESGMKRDDPAGKPKFGLMMPKGVPYEEQLLTRLAALYERGGAIYGDRNWEKSSTEEDLERHTESLLRHVMKFVNGVEDGEDHAAAIMWNVNAVELTKRNIKKSQASAASPVEYSAEAHDWAAAPLLEGLPAELARWRESYGNASYGE